jgi:hypothetical protein
VAIGASARAHPAAVTINNAFERLLTCNTS